MAKGTVSQRAKELVEFARASKATTWTELRNSIYGIGGKLYELFPSKADRAAFLKSGAAAEIRDLIELLPAGPVIEAQNLASVSGKILLRVPKSIHAALLVEAEAEEISLNQLLLAKVTLPLQAIAS